ncbi:MAG: PD-(D/E)XK nuclease family protein [Congregibacter sp.]
MTYTGAGTGTDSGTEAEAAADTDSQLAPLFADIEHIGPLLREGFALLTPNRRLSRAVRHAEQLWRQNHGEHCWNTSTVMPLEQYWLERWASAVTRGFVAPRRVLDSFGQRLLWEQVIEEADASFTLLSASKAAQLCQQALNTLLSWRVDLEASAIRQAFEFDDDGRAFLVWTRAFLSRLAARDCLLPEQACAQLLDNPAAAILDQPLALLCVDELPPLYRALCEKAPSWQHLKPPAPRCRSVNARAYSDPRSELRAAAAWCREQHQTNPRGRYAVVLSDMREDRDRLEFFLRQEFGCLTREYESLPVNFATGFSLDRTPLIRDALAILECSQADVDTEQYIALIQSRFVALDCGESAASPSGLQDMQVRALRELCAESMPQRLLRQVLADCVERYGRGHTRNNDEGNGSTSTVPSDPEMAQFPWKYLRSLEGEARLRSRSRLPSEWIAVLNAILGSWGWPNGRTLDSLEYQQFQQWLAALDDFSGLDALCGPLSFERCVQRLRTFIADKQFQPQTADSALQVLGPLETTGLCFDGSWVVGMSSAHWPASARPNPYIPIALQRQQRMPHADAAWESEWSSQRWQQWLAGSREVHASFVNLAEGVEVQPSPLLQTVEIVVEEHAPVMDPRWDAQRELLGFEVVPLIGVPLLHDEPSAHGVGTAALEHQANCPFRAFAAVRLRAQASPMPALGLLPSERGILLHRALYNVFGEFPDRQTLVDSSEAQRDEAIAAAIVDARKGLRRERLQLLGTALLELEHRRLARVIAQWLQIEMSRTADFTVFAREDNRQLTLDALPLRMRVDRIDTLANGEQVIVDYKSGNPESLSRWFGERPLRPQLPLYALLDPPPAGIAYAVLKQGALGFRGVAEDAFAPGIEQASRRVAARTNPEAAATDLPPGSASNASAMAMHTLRADWTHELGLLAREFLAGHSAVLPTADACRYCHRQPLCRVDDLRS